MRLSARGKLYVMRQSDGAQGRDHVPVGIDLPPAQAMARGAGMRVVIVVPAFAEGEQRDEEIVGGVVAGRPALRAPEMGGGVHQPGGVQADHGAEEDAPEHHVPPAEVEDRGTDHDLGDPVVFAEPEIKLVAAQIGNVRRKLLRFPGEASGRSESSPCATTTCHRAESADHLRGR